MEVRADGEFLVTLIVGMLLLRSCCPDVTVTTGKGDTYKVHIEAERKP